MHVSSPDTPDPSSGVQREWVQHWNTVAKWNGAQWVSLNAWVGPFWQQTGGGDNHYFNGRWGYNGTSEHALVTRGYYVGIQWTQYHSTKRTVSNYVPTHTATAVNGTATHNTLCVAPMDRPY